MTQPRITELPYRADAGPLFEAVRDLSQACWLDSGRPWSRFGRYDIICARPDILLTTRGGRTTVSSNAGEVHSSDNPLELIKYYLAPLRISAARELPFCGGALGYFAYDLGNLEQGRQYSQFASQFKTQFDDLCSAGATDISLPDMHIGIYSWCIVQDHQRRRAWLICLPGAGRDFRRELMARLSASAVSPPPPDRDGKLPHESFQIRDLSANLSRDAYREKLARINDYIHAGDCYQVNFAQRFSAAFSGSSYAAYRRLRRALPSPFSAFLSLDYKDGGSATQLATDSCAVLSLSPERFLRLSGRQVETRPIKGTLPRDPSPAQDRLNAKTLRASSKDRAENLMIVDLLRNDLGKSCLPGSIRVPELFALESFPNVHHLVSTVTGTLAADKTPLDLLRDCFPGGSITGAPKLRAMEIIAELEPHRRSVYCGSIGYLSANGNMDTNIAIRTLVRDRDRIHCWGGGGIVADSEPDLEYAESLAKVQALLDCLSQFGGQ